MPESVNPVRILMVEDHVLLRGALARTLEAEPDLHVVGECSEIDEALEIVASQPVDVVLLDINLGSEQGGSFLTRAPGIGYKGKILVVTAGVGEREAGWLLNRGCSAIFLKTEPLSNLIDLVRNAVRSSEQPHEPRVAPAADSADSQTRKPLTRRESLVLRYICEGMANKEIAQQMDVTEYSVKSYVQQLFAKTGARSRAQLVTLAIEKYWDQLEPR